jgi:hypothetical protein
MLRRKCFEKDFCFSQVGNIYPESSSLKTRFGLNDPKRNQPNFTPKSQVDILEKEKTIYKNIFEVLIRKYRFPP